MGGWGVVMFCGFGSGGLGEVSGGWCLILYCEIEARVRGKVGGV